MVTKLHPQISGNCISYDSDPSQLVVDRFEEIYQQQIKGTPIENPALSVEAVGFQLWNNQWVGILITPWFLNLMIMSAEKTGWSKISADAQQQWQFPCGPISMLKNADDTLGLYYCCSLASPMSAFDSHESTRQTALEIMQMLFVAGNETNDVTQDQKQASLGKLNVDAERKKVAVSRRSFLRGVLGSGDKP